MMDDYSSNHPRFVQTGELADVQKYRLMDSKVFCMMPWIHVHGWPSGEAYPCCMADSRYPVGNMRTSTLEEIWNDPQYRGMRTSMLGDKPCKECVKCYDQESNGIVSARQMTNRSYGQYISEVDLTRDDGHHPEFKIRHWDIRFSNICNFKCRTCGPNFSSHWYEDAKQQFSQIGIHKFMYAGKNKDDIWNQMQPHLEHLDHIYFAGGEPLITDEHYKILLRLIEMGRTDVRLSYNTNLSEFSYKKHDVLNLWSHFEHVSVGASLDASGHRAEYMRKGTKWEQIVNNRIRMMKEVPHVEFFVSPTVSNMNVLHIHDFHKEWVDLGLIRPDEFSINVLYHPSHYRVDALPGRFKKIAAEKIMHTLEWLRDCGGCQRAINGYEGLMRFMMTKDNIHHMEAFFSEMKRLDKIRKEEFTDAFPELADLEDEYKKEKQL